MIIRLHSRGQILHRGPAGSEKATDPANKVSWCSNLTKDAGPQTTATEQQRKGETNAANICMPRSWESHKKKTPEMCPVTLVWFSPPTYGTKLLDVDGIEPTKMTENGGTKDFMGAHQRIVKLMQNNTMKNGVFCGRYYGA